MDGNPTVLLQTSKQSWLLFSDPIQVFTTTIESEVLPILEELAAQTAKGYYAAGFLSYEAAAAMDSALVVRSSTSSLPLLWFGLFHQPQLLPEPPPNTTQPSPIPFSTAMSKQDYLTAITRIRQLIHQGDTYQVNYTFPLTAAFDGNAYALFHALVRAQPSECSAFVQMPGHTLCSASPELFFALDADGRIEARPMKGTAARGLTSAEDKAEMQKLQTSEKARAENIMIVDMIRNDLGRVCEPGSVRVTRTFDIERYPTVLQMTSTVEGVTHSTVPDILKAIFPCASITGAPKVRTMQIIRDLEQSPRGIYTGSIGYFGPGPRSRFNVAIRTVHVDHQRNEARYGIGSGIVWDSLAEDEYDECLTKANVLTTPAPPPFSLLETMLWEPDTGIFLLDRHMNRLSDSANYFSIPIDLGQIRHQLESATENLPSMPHKIRLLVNQQGTAAIECTVFTPTTGSHPITLLRAPHPINSKDLFLYHKTTHRAVYDELRKQLGPNEDLVFSNNQSQITETSIANIVIERNGQKLTPPVSCGLLPGSFRQELLESGQISEAILTWHDLLHADKVWLINSVRRWVPAAIHS